jgi:hypothetical protein
VFSLSTVIKYIRSDLVALDYIQGQGLTGNSFASDIGLFYCSDMYIGDKDGVLSMGLNVSNIGPNIKYGLLNQPMPTLARLGGSYHATIDESIAYAMSIELHKILVKNTGNMPNVSLGLELSLLKKIALRTGYYKSENFPEKGQYLTAGLGLNHSNYGFNLSYLFPTQKYSALDNTIRYSLNYTLGTVK